jgi:hypothetical protein
MAKSFSDMTALVNAITKRPELVTLTEAAVRTATLRAHHTDFFHRDRDSVVLTYTVPASGSFVDIAGVYTSAPQLRAAEFMQSEDATTFTATENLEWVTSFKNFFDDTNVAKLSVFTVLGETIKASFASATGRARLFYYKNPVVTNAAYASWIADAHSDEVAMWAAGIVWARTGNQEMAREAQTAVEMFKADLLASYLMNKI